jgi:hypothetical protein
VSVHLPHGRKRELELLEVFQPRVTKSVATARIDGKQTADPRRALPDMAA